MQTLCPICHTIFRVTAETLKQSDGMVQCGVCGMVFMAEEHQMDLAGAQTARAASEPLQEHDAAAASSSLTLTSLELPADIADSLWSAGSDDAEVATAAPLIGPLPQLAGAANSSFGADEQAVAISEPSTDPIDFKSVGKKKASPVWMGGAAFLLVLLLLQFAYLFRDSLAAAFPRAKPGLAATCQAFGCSVGLPHDINSLRIDSTEFKVDAQHPNRVHVELGLENQGLTSLALPHVALALTNDADEVLARRNFGPADYLGDSRAIAAGIAPQQLITGQLTLDMSGINASNYKVFLFYTR